MSEQEQERTLVDNYETAERLDIVEGDVGEKEEESRGEQANLFRHVMEAREEDKAAVDKADQEEKEQVLLDNWDS